jgi:hypothetical protein
MSTLRFEERQSFRQPWLWVLMLATLALLLVASLLAPEGQTVPWVVLGIVLATGLLLYSMRLSVQVDTGAIRISFFPIWKKTIPLAEVVRWEARTLQRPWQPGRAAGTGELPAHPDRVTAGRGTGGGDWGGQGAGVTALVTWIERAAVLPGPQQLAGFRRTIRCPSPLRQQVNGQQRHQMSHEKPQVRAFQGVGDKNLVCDQEGAPQE